MVENLPWCTASQRCGTCCYKDNGNTIRYLACSSASWDAKTGFTSSGKCDAARSNYLSKAASKLTKRCAGLKDETLRQCLSGVGSGKTTPKLPLSKPVPRGSPITPAPTKYRAPTKSTPRATEPTTATPTPSLPPSDESTDFFTNNGIFIIAALAIVVLLVVL